MSALAGLLAAAALPATALLGHLVQPCGRITWSNPAGGSWPQAGNWAGGAVANGTGYSADFSTQDLTAAATVCL
jgi:hypothetical protein